MDEVDGFREDASAFRLEEITIMKDTFAREIVKRRRLGKKCKSVASAFEVADTILLGVTLALVGSGTGLLATVVAVPVAAGLGMGAAVCGVLGITAKAFRKLFLGKLKKQKELLNLATSRMNTMTSLLSEAMDDGHISDDEFQRAIDMMHQYHIKRDNIAAVGNGNGNGHGRRKSSAFGLYFNALSKKQQPAS